MVERTTIRPIVGGVTPLARTRSQLSGEGSGDVPNQDVAERDLLNDTGDRGRSPRNPARTAGPAGDRGTGRPSSASEHPDERLPFPIRLAPDVAIAAGYEPPAGEPVAAQAATRRYLHQADMLGRIRTAMPNGTGVDPLGRPLGRLTDEEA